MHFVWVARVHKYKFNLFSGTLVFSLLPLLSWQPIILKLRFRIVVWCSMKPHRKPLKILIIWSGYFPKYSREIEVKQCASATFCEILNHSNAMLPDLVINDFVHYIWSSFTFYNKWVFQNFITDYWILEKYWIKMNSRLSMFTTLGATWFNKNLSMSLEH